MRKFLSILCTASIASTMLFPAVAFAGGASSSTVRTATDAEARKTGAIVISAASVTTGDTFPVYATGNDQSNYPATRTGDTGSITLFRLNGTDTYGATQSGTTVEGLDGVGGNAFAVTRGGLQWAPSAGLLNAGKEYDVYIYHIMNTLMSNNVQLELYHSGTPLSGGGHATSSGTRLAERVLGTNTLQIDQTYGFYGAANNNNGWIYVGTFSGFKGDGNDYAHIRVVGSANNARVDAISFVEAEPLDENSNRLTGISFNRGAMTPSLNPDVTEGYTANVPYRSVTVTAITDSPNATITINGSDATSGTAFPLGVLSTTEPTTVSIAVTPANYGSGGEIKTYTITVTGRDNSGENLITNGDFRTGTGPWFRSLNENNTTGGEATLSWDSARRRAQIDMAASGSGPQAVVFRQNFSTTLYASLTYVLTATVYSSATTADDISIQIALQTPAYSTVNGASTTTKTAGHIRQVIIPFTIGETDVNTLRLDFRLGSNSSTYTNPAGTIWIDDVALYEANALPALTDFKLVADNPAFLKQPDGGQQVLFSIEPDVPNLIPNYSNINVNWYVDGVLDGTTGYRKRFAYTPSSAQANHIIKAENANNQDIYAESAVGVALVNYDCVVSDLAIAGDTMSFDLYSAAAADILIAFAKYSADGSVIEEVDIVNLDDKETGKVDNISVPSWIGDAEIFMWVDGIYQPITLPVQASSVITIY